MILLKSNWNGKRVIVSTPKFSYHNGLTPNLKLKIKVEETYDLPHRFVRGAVHHANLDIINSVGGLPAYIGKVLDCAAMQEWKRRTTPMKEQLTLF